MSDNPDQPQSTPPAEQPREGTATRQANKGAVPYLLLVIWLLGGAAIYFTQRPQFFDHQIGNLITLIVGFVMFVSVLLYFCLQSWIPIAVRFAVPGLLVASVALFFVFYRIEEVSGELVPKFTYRFAPPADAQIAAPEEANVGVDLTSETTNDFPQFLGPDRNATYEGVKLATDWEAKAPELLWRQPIGAGWGSFAVVNGFAVTLEQRGVEEQINCYEVETGRRCWSHSHQWRHETLMGGVGPRSTPTIEGGRVYALGAGGMLFCLAGDTGDLLWQRDLLAEFDVTKEADAKNIAWGRAASPLVVGNKVIVPAGGPTDDPVSLVAYDKLTGEEIWRGGNSQISYASARLATIGGVQQVLIVNESSVAGHDLESGQQLWSHEWPGASNASASVSDAVGLPGDQVLVSKGYGGGSAVFEITQSGEDWGAKPLWENAGVLKTKFSNVVVHGGAAYALSDGILEGVDLSTGDRLWKKGRYGHGQVLLVEDDLLVLDESGDLHLLSIGEKKPVELAETEAISGKTWNTFAMYGPLFLVRNSDEAACYRLPIEEQ